MDESVKLELLDLLNDFKENELIARKNKNTEGERTFQFCRVALEVKCEKLGIHVGRTIDVNP